MNDTTIIIPHTLKQIITFLFDCKFTIGGVTVSFGNLLFYLILFTILAKIVHVIFHGTEDDY